MSGEGVLPHVIYREDALDYAPKLIGDVLSSLLARKGGSIATAVAGGRAVPEALGNVSVDWRRVEVFLADERLVPLPSKDRNFPAVRESLVGKAGLPVQNLHPFVMEEGVRGYERELSAFGKAFDAVILSAGEDGHVASLFPRLSVMDDSEGFLELHDSPKPPSARMSMSRRLLLSSRAGILLFIGEGKRRALERFLDSSVSWEDCPAKLVARLPEYHVLTDMRPQSDPHA